MPWSEANDPRTGKPYYYHTETRETRWVRPPEMDASLPRSQFATKFEAGDRLEAGFVLRTGWEAISQQLGFQPPEVWWKAVRVKAVHRPQSAAVWWTDEDGARHRWEGQDELVYELEEDAGGGFNLLEQLVQGLGGSDVFGRFLTGNLLPESAATKGLLRWPLACSGVAETVRAYLEALGAGDAARALWHHHSVGLIVYNDIATPGLGAMHELSMKNASLFCENMYESHLAGAHDTFLNARRRVDDSQNPRALFTALIGGGRLKVMQHVTREAPADGFGAALILCEVSGGVTSSDGKQRDGIKSPARGSDYLVFRIVIDPVTGKIPLAYVSLMPRSSWPAGHYYFEGKDMHMAAMEALFQQRPSVGNITLSQIPDDSMLSYRGLNYDKNPTKSGGLEYDSYCLMETYEEEAVLECFDLPDTAEGSVGRTTAKGKFGGDSIACFLALSELDDGYRECKYKNLLHTAHYYKVGMPRPQAISTFDEKFAFEIAFNPTECAEGEQAGRPKAQLVIFEWSCPEAGYGYHNEVLMSSPCQDTYSWHTVVRRAAGEMPSADASVSGEVAAMFSEADTAAQEKDYLLAGKIYYQILMKLDPSHSCGPTDPVPGVPAHLQDKITWSKMEETVGWILNNVMSKMH